MQLELFEAPVCCAFCGKPTYSPTYKEKHFGKTTQQLAFCGEGHATDYYLEKLREKEGSA